MNKLFRIILTKRLKTIQEDKLKIEEYPELDKEIDSFIQEVCAFFLNVNFTKMLDKFRNEKSKLTESELIDFNKKPSPIIDAIIQKTSVKSLKANIIEVLDKILDDESKRTKEKLNKVEELTNNIIRDIVRHIYNPLGERLDGIQKEKSNKVNKLSNDIIRDNVRHFYEGFLEEKLHQISIGESKTTVLQLFKANEMVDAVIEVIKQKSNVDPFKEKLYVKNEINNVSEFIEEIKLKSKDKSRLFYRGHGNNNYLLTPSTHRNDKIDEKTIFLDYSHFSPAHNLKREREIDTLIDMQHYELPTRLLDWSLSPLYALFFACYDESGANKYNDAEVYIFNPWKYNQLIVNYEDKKHPEIHDIHIYARVLLAKGYKVQNVVATVSDKYQISLSEEELKLPFAMVGDYHNKRNQSQKGTFTIHGIETNDLVSLLKDFQDEPQKFQRKDFDITKFILKDIIQIVKIPYDKKPKILEELNILNIHPYSIYPDPHGMSRYLKSNPQGFFKSRKM